MITKIYSTPRVYNYNNNNLKTKASNNYSTQVFESSYKKPTNDSLLKGIKRLLSSSKSKLASQKPIIEQKVLELIAKPGTEITLPNSVDTEGNLKNIKVTYKKVEDGNKIRHLIEFKYETDSGEGGSSIPLVEKPQTIPKKIETIASKIKSAIEEASEKVNERKEKEKYYD